MDKNQTSSISWHYSPNLQLTRDVTTMTDRELLDALVGHVQRQAEWLFAASVAQQFGRTDDIAQNETFARQHESWWTDCYVEIVRRLSGGEDVDG